MPTSLFVRGREEIERFGEVTLLAARVIDRFLPGPLTLVIRARGTWEPHVVTDERIGLRWSPSEIIRGLLQETIFPLTATSANLSGQPDAETIVELADGLGESVQLYLDAGPLKGITSTVVDCSGERPIVLREGAISQELLLANVKDLLPG
jgi:tRNA threonylcarbamoyl adenosine modification protein (Sua5/YciO/YrdC/YwlC family)